MTRGPRNERYPDPPGGSPTDLNTVLRVTERRRYSAACVSVAFARPRGFSYVAGGWMDIRFLPAELAVGRTFSFASSPTEGALRILFRSGVTPFKRRLQTVEPGDIALITQYGVNELRFERAPAVLIAGGVGIAPFRSIVKRAVDCGDPLDATLIYVDRSDTDFPFQDELRIWSREVPGFRSEFVATARDGRLTASTLRRLIGSPSPHEQVFYLAGPPAMVTATEALLADLGVARNQIRADPFEGY